jgi:hypothetical protein
MAEEGGQRQSLPRDQDLVRARLQWLAAQGEVPRVHRVVAQPPPEEERLEATAEPEPASQTAALLHEYEAARKTAGTKEQVMDRRPHWDSDGVSTVIRAFQLLDVLREVATFRQDPFGTEDPRRAEAITNGVITALSSLGASGNPKAAAALLEAMEYLASAVQRLLEERRLMPTQPPGGLQ